MLEFPTVIRPSGIQSTIIYKPLVVSPETKVIEAITLMSQVRSNNSDSTSTHDRDVITISSCVLVVEDDQLLGIFTKKDIVNIIAKQKPLDNLVMREVMVHPPITLYESELRNKFFVLNLLQQHRIHHLPILDKNNRLLGVVTYESLQKIERTTRSYNTTKLQENLIPTSVFMILEDGRFAYVNETACSTLGYTKEELLKLSVTDINVNASSQWWEKNWQKTKKLHNLIIETRHISKNGSTYPVEISSHYVNIENEEYILACVTDIKSRQYIGLERRQLIQELLDFKLTLDKSAIVAITNSQGIITYVNNFFCELSGYSQNELIGKTHKIINSGYHSQDFFKDLWRTISSGQIWRGEICNRAKDGSLYWVASTLIPFVNQQGKPFQYLAIRFNITDRKKAENTIRYQAEREKLLREISNRIRDSLDIKNIFDTACEEIRQFMQADRVGIFKFDISSKLEKGEFIAESVVTDFPSIIQKPVEDHCFRDNYEYLYNQGEFIAESVVTDFPSIIQKPVEEPCFGKNYISLYSQGRFFACPDIYNFNLQKCHIDILKKFQIRANLVVPLFMQDKLWGLLCIHQCQTTRQWQEDEIELSKQLANQLTIAINQANLFEKLKQQLIEQQEAKDQLSERNYKLAFYNEELARATRLKDEFLASMSHELRTPLNAILGMAEGLQERVFGNITEEQSKALKTIERSGSHLLELINDILDIAKIESGKLKLDCQFTDLSRLCESSLAFIKQQALTKSIQLEIRKPLNIPEVLIDERRMRQVLINLLNNAVKFTPEGGNVTLEIKYEQSLEKLNLDNHISPIKLQIRIIDNGIGIAQEHMEKLFEPFIQIDSALNRKYTGTGLGLSLVKRIVELHDGQVKLNSTVGEGSCFTINFPHICSKPFPTPIQSSTYTDIKLEELEEGQCPYILLVEDNDANIATISSYLKAKKMRVILAKSGKEAIALLESETPDLILMDIQMPEMDGLEAIKNIRNHHNLKNVPIIALTSLAMIGDRERCLAAGANHYMTKPVRLKHLVNVIKQFI
ncbi:MAG: PAS domain S-box protein [Calothrix sp. MO_167.B12]|nr:PAS domain S-box protein [Calothrix sp. MO_167.B12]